VYVLAAPVKGLYQEIYFYRRKNDKTQMITFDSAQEANECLNLFQQWATAEIISTNPFGFAEIVNLCSSFELKEIPKGITCDLISFKDLMREKNI
jgi:hypothetical protein